MNTVSFFLPAAHEIRGYLKEPSLDSIINSCKECEEPFEPRYSLFGYKVFSAQPYSINTLITCLFMNLVPGFTTTYTKELGKRFVHIVHEAQFEAAIVKISSLSKKRFMGSLAHPSIVPFALTPTQKVWLKGHQDEADARGAMENLVWDCAKVLKLEDYFAPTRLSPSTGCLQLDIKGTSLLELNMAFFDLDKPNTIIGTMISILFGFSDANENNIIIDKTNTPHFFDNSRSFCHSTEYIERPNEDYISSFRCGLVACKEFYTPFSEADWILLNSLVARFEEGLPEMIGCISALENKNLPKTWVNVPKMTDALVERFVNLQTAVQSRAVNSLRDLVFFVHPHYRFLCALVMAEANPNTPAYTEIELLMSVYRSGDAEKRQDSLIKLQRIVNVGICGNGFDIKVVMGDLLRLPVYMLWTESEDLKKPFDEILDAIIKSRQTDRAMKIRVDAIWALILARSTVDYKC